MFRCLKRCRLDPATTYDRSKITSVPLAVHSVSSSLVLPSSHPSTLQTYSPLTSKLLSEIEISPSNRVSRRDEDPLEPCRVELTSVSDGGDWMATAMDPTRRHTFSAPGAVILDRLTNLYLSAYRCHLSLPGSLCRQASAVEQPAT